MYNVNLDNIILIHLTWKRLVPSVLTPKSTVCGRSPSVRNRAFCLENLANDVQKPGCMFENV